MKRIAIAALLSLLAAPAEAARIYTMEVKGPIFTPVLQYLSIALDQAEKGQAAALLLELDTPGGALDTTKEIVQTILAAPLPVIVYVSPSGAGATSAGTFVTLAAHVAAMAPGTTIGAAHPVSILPSDQPNEIMEKKIENYAVSFIEAIASQRGRNVQWAAEAVRQSASITAEQALEKKVVDVIAPSREALMVAIQGREVKVRDSVVKLETANPQFHEIDMTAEQRFYFFVSHPTIIFLLLVGGLAALYIEFTHPGAVAPGVVGAICLLLAAIGFSIVPVNLTGAALMGLGVAMLLSELFVPSFGALGVGKGCADGPPTIGEIWGTKSDGPGVFRRPGPVRALRAGTFGVSSWGSKQRAPERLDGCAEASPGSGWGSAPRVRCGSPLRAAGDRSTARRSRR